MKITCPHCSHASELPKGGAPARATCTSCGEVFAIAVAGGRRLMPFVVLLCVLAGVAVGGLVWFLWLGRLLPGGIGGARGVKAAKPKTGARAAKPAPRPRRDYSHYVTQLEDFTRKYLSAKFDEEQHNVDVAVEDPNHNFWGQRFGLHRLPWPAWKRRSLAQALNECWLDVVLLVGSAAILFLVSFIGFVRYDPR